MKRIFQLAINLLKSGASPFGSGHPWLRFTSVSPWRSRLPSYRSGPLLPLTLQQQTGPWSTRVIRTFSWLALCGILGLVSCADGERLPYGEFSLITGIATPIVLEPDTTVVYLSDYFDSTTEISEVIPPKGIELIVGKSPGEVLLIPGPDTRPLSYLTVYSKSKHPYEILVRRSFKQSIDFSFDPGDESYSEVQLTGDINAWNPANTPLQFEDGQWRTTLSLNPGVYGYQLVLDGTWTLDPAAPAIDNGMGGMNSQLIMPAADPSDLPYVYASETDGLTLRLGSASAPGRILVFWENSLLADTLLGESFSFHLPSSANNVARSFIRVYSYNESGLGNDLLIPIEQGSVVLDAAALERTDLHTQIMYFLMVDRFANADSENDRPEDDPMIHPLANFKGGDLAGINRKLEEGYFDSLGVNTIWLSPIPKNPHGAYGLWDKGGVKSTFSAYHGYWPIGLSDVDARFGTKSELKSLIDGAHENDMNIILDFVAHHIHEEHPLYQEKKDEDWFTDLYLPDGTLNTERWDDHRLTTWFDVFLPTFNFFNPEVNDMLSDTAMYWLHEFGIDGFRHDATKHIHLDFWRSLTAKVKAYKRNTGLPAYQVGETYGTPDLIASYISTGMLDAQFDFNLFDAAISVLCRPNKDFNDLKRRMEQSLRYYGYNHLMGNMSGNQDRARFMAYATGDISFEEDAKLAGWTRDIELRNQAGFDRLAQMHAFNLTIPGVPCIYYGDEIGMTGGNDPDNRRMMYFENWTAEESRLYSAISKLAKLRTSHMALLYGDFRFLPSDELSTLAYSRRYFDSQAIVIFNKGGQPTSLTLEVPKDYSIEAGFISLSGRDFTLNDGILKVEIPANGYEVIYK